MIEARIRKQFPAGRESAAFTLDLEFRAEAGVTVLFGPSGAGKTLTLDSIAGFVRPDEGRIILDDHILFDGAARVNLVPQERQCGYVFQNYALFPHMTLRQNLEFAAERQPRLGRHRRVAEMLEKFHLTQVAGRRSHELSGGQKQRCSIARALMGSPKILLLDEPGRGLDAPLRAEFYAVLRQVREEFTLPVLLVTHDLEECFELGDQMLVVREGGIVQSGPPAEILERPSNVEVARLLGRYNLLAGEIRALDPGRNLSRIRCGDHEIAGPYLPGHLIGDRIWLCLRPAELQASPRNGRLAANQIPASLQRVVELPRVTRLEFDQDLVVELPYRPHGPDLSEREWTIDIPASAIRVI
jgi:molybdate transport system ATP-binding protein